MVADERNSTDPALPKSLHGAAISCPDVCAPGRSPVTRPISATLVLGLGTVISHGFGLSLIPAMLPRISEDFGVGYGVLGSVTAVGLVAYAGGALATGRIVDAVPSRALLVGSYAVTGTGLLGAGAAGSPSMLAASAVVLGIAAPISWAVTLHVAGATIEPGRRAGVMAAAASGAAVGVLVNGVLVQTSETLHTWRVSFVIATALAILPIVGALIVFREPVTRPRPAGAAVVRAGYRRVLEARPGRVVVAAGLVAGAAGFPFAVFLTATAIDELGVSAFRAGLLWWIIGAVGTLAGPIFGRYGDRTSPLAALTAGAVAYAGGLVVLAASWTYAGLALAAAGYALMNYPVWGLVGAVANRHFDAEVSVRAIALGLMAASSAGAAASAGAGAWIDATGSFRVPGIGIAAVAAALSTWYLVLLAKREAVEPALGSGQHAAPVAYDP